MPGTVIDINGEMSYENPATADLAPQSDSTKADLKSLVGDVVYRVQGCSDLMVRKMLQEAWRDFAERTGIMKYTFSATLASATYRYALSDASTDDETCVGSIECAWMKKSGEAPRRLFEARDIVLDTKSSPQAIVLTKLPTITGTDAITNYTVVAQLRMLPKRGSENIPTGILERHGGAIVHGALARMFAMANQAWSDTAQAQIESALYDKACEDASENTVFGDHVGNGRFTMTGAGL